jgi:hypothetical protein
MDKILSALDSVIPSIFNRLIYVQAAIAVLSHCLRSTRIYEAAQTIFGPLHYL